MTHNITSRQTRRNLLLSALLVVAAQLASPAVYAQTVSAQPSCHAPADASVQMKGTIVRLGGNEIHGALGLRREDGSVFPLVGAPHCGRNGVLVEIRGLLCQVDGKQALRIDQVRTPAGNWVAADRKFPVQGRCEHCGCRLQVDNAADLSKTCDMCKCKKSNGQCLQH